MHCKYNNFVSQKLIFIINIPCTLKITPQLRGKNWTTARTRCIQLRSTCGCSYNPYFYAREKEMKHKINANASFQQPPCFFQRLLFPRRGLYPRRWLCFRLRPLITSALSLNCHSCVCRLRLPSYFSARQRCVCCSLYIFYTPCFYARARGIGNTNEEWTEPKARNSKK